MNSINVKKDSVKDAGVGASANTNETVEVAQASNPEKVKMIDKEKIAKTATILDFSEDV